MSSNINLKTYILDKYVPIKLADQTLQTVFNDTSEYGRNYQLDSEAAHGQQKCPSLSFPFARSPLFALPLKKATFLVPQSEESNNSESSVRKSVIEITFDSTSFNDLNLSYQPGDTIGILPHNPEDKVSQVLKACGLINKANTQCTLQVTSTCAKKTSKVPPYIPATSTPLEILRDCINIRGVLKKQFIRQLATYCTNNDEQAFLNSLSSKEGSSFYNLLILEKGITFLELLEMCPSCQPTLELIVEHLPRLLPRPYSIVNSSLNNSNEIIIIFSIWDKNPGLTTNMLQNLAIREDKNDIPLPTALIYLRETNKFRYSEEECNYHQILIGVGTGLAPFFGFLEHKAFQSKINNKQLGETWLFAGATHPNNLIHRDRFQQFQASNMLNGFYESFSRLFDTKFHYVQDQLQEQANAFVDLLMRKNTILFVCADGAEISKSIELSIKKCLSDVLNIQDEQVVVQLIKDFRANGKYREDLWL